MTLPGIQYIFTCACENLVPDIEYRHRAGIEVAILTKLTPVTFYGEPICECNDAPLNNHQVQKATLSFLTDRCIPTEKNLAFVIVDAYGQSWVIGHREPPYPQISQVKRTGTTQGDPAGWSVEVSHSAILALIPCIKQ